MRHFYFLRVPRKLKKKNKFLADIAKQKRIFKYIYLKYWS